MKCLKLYTWVIFNEGQKKEWFNIIIPFIELSSDIDDNKSYIEDHLSDNGIIYELNDYSTKHSYGSYDYGIESYEIIEYDFDTYMNLYIEPTSSLSERKKEIKKMNVYKNLSDYKINEDNIEFTGAGIISYKDKLFGNIELNLHDLKDFLNNKTHINASILNDRGEKILEICSDKNEHTGRMLRIKGLADYQFYWDGVPEKTGFFTPDGDVGIYNRKEEERIDLVSDEKWIRINRQNFFKKLIELKEEGKKLNPMNLIDSVINK